MISAGILALCFTAGYTVIIGISMIAAKVRKKTPINCRFYPTLKGLRTAFREKLPRLLFITGFVLGAGYLTYIYIEFIKLNIRPHGLLWPPHYLFSVSFFLWNILWICDALRKENRDALLPALLCTAWNICLLIVLSIATCFIVE